MHKEYFTYEQNAPFKVFPIDFSLREFDTTHKGNFSRAQAVVQHPFLDNVLLKLIWDDDLEESKFFPEYEGIYPLPVEAETFLRCFYDLIEKGDYHTTPRTAEKLKSPDLKRRFSKDLCRGIAKRIFSSEAGPHFDDTVYCRHMLCHNEGFCRVLVDDLWPNAIKNRIKQIELLAMNVSPVQQTILLQGVLLALDNMCLDLIRSTPSNITKPTSTPPLPNELLRDLLSKRVKIPKSQNEKHRSNIADGFRTPQKKRAVYKVKRINLKAEKSGKSHKMSLENAFKALQNHRNPNPKLMKQARITYIENLEKSVEQSQFEKQYLEFQKYLNVTSEKPDVNNLEWCFQFIERLFSPPENSKTDSRAKQK